MGEIDPKDLIGPAIALIGLLLSIFTLYRTQFRRSDIRALIGPDFHFYYDEAGHPAVYLPVVFQNESPTTGFVSKALITIFDAGGRAYSMTWWNSFEVKWPEVEYVYKGRARPKKVAGYDSVADVLWGVCPSALNGIPLAWVAGKYRVRLSYWTKNGKKPDAYVEAEVEVTEEADADLRLRRARKETNSRYEYFEGRALMAFVDDGEPDFSKRQL